MLKRFLEKLKAFIFHEHCYANMESFGIAVFGCCRGGDGRYCKSCRYFTPTEEEVEV